MVWIINFGFASFPRRVLGCSFHLCYTCHTRIRKSFAEEHLLCHQVHHAFLSWQARVRLFTLHVLCLFCLWACAPSGSGAAGGVSSSFVSLGGNPTVPRGSTTPNDSPGPGRQPPVHGEDPEWLSFDPEPRQQPPILSPRVRVKVAH